MVTDHGLLIKRRKHMWAKSLVNSLEMNQIVLIAVLIFPCLAIFDIHVHMHIEVLPSQLTEVITRLTTRDSIVDIYELISRGYHSVYIIYTKLHGSQCIQ